MLAQITDCTLIFQEIRQHLKRKRPFDGNDVKELEEERHSKEIGNGRNSIMISGNRIPPNSVECKCHNEK